MEYDRERAYEQNTIAGHGTDSAAAHGGGIADTHRERTQRSPGGKSLLLKSNLAQNLTMPRSYVYVRFGTSYIC
jgi:hypothetical protein